MARLAAGDRDALGPLMERHYRRLFRIALGYLRDTDEALDAVQETFVKAFQHAARWDGWSEVGPWLSRIAVNHSIDRYRRGRRRRASGGAAAGRRTTTSALAADEPSPERRVLGREIGERIGAALRALPETQRAVFVLRHYEEMKLEEIADTPGHQPGHREEQPASRGAPPARPAGGRARVSLLHGRWRRRVSLLAAGALAARERADAARARRPCARCRARARRAWALLALLALDPAARAEPPLAASALVARVQRAPRAEPAASRRARAGLAWSWRRWLAAAAAAWSPCSPCSTAVRPRRPPAPRHRADRGGGLRRDARPARAQRWRASSAARYLSEAQDVLVNVAAAAATATARTSASTWRRRRGAAASCWPAGRCWWRATASR